MTHTYADGCAQSYWARGAPQRRHVIPKGVFEDGLAFERNWWSQAVHVAGFLPSSRRFLRTGSLYLFSVVRFLGTVLASHGREPATFTKSDASAVATSSSESGQPMVVSKSFFSFQSSRSSSFSFCGRPQS